jgi:4-methyl-5(b-hydroxyethyl)-thiazole monophosphate biosynthesis
MNYLFLADGFEEVEALTSVDVLRRAGMPVTTVSINPGLEVTGAHGVTVLADSLYDDNDYSVAEWLILPGGIPGAPNLAAHEALCNLLVSHEEAGGRVAAICASPAVVLGPLGLLADRNAVCYPGMEETVEGVDWGRGAVAVDGPVVTGNGPAAAAAFALTIVAQSMGRDVAHEVASGMLLPENIIA